LSEFPDGWILFDGSHGGVDIDDVSI
jgi:hypothetical protein